MCPPLGGWGGQLSPLWHFPRGSCPQGQMPLPLDFCPRVCIFTPNIRPRRKDLQMADFCPHDFFCPAEICPLAIHHMKRSCRNLGDKFYRGGGIVREKMSGVTIGVQKSKQGAFVPRVTGQKSWRGKWLEVNVGGSTGGNLMGTNIRSFLIWFLYLLIRFLVIYYKWSEF